MNTIIYLHIASHTLLDNDNTKKEAHAIYGVGLHNETLIGPI